MILTSSKNRLIFVLIPALLICQIIALCATILVSNNLAKADLVSDVASSIGIFRYASLQRATHLMQAADLVSKDFGFREAVASNQLATINSVLQNQKNRVGADVAVLTSLNGKMLGSSLENVKNSKKAPLDYIFSLSVKDIELDSLNLRALEIDNDRILLFQWVQAVVRSPAPVARLSLAFAFNDATAQRFKTLTNSDFLFMSRDRGDKWRLHASSFPEEFTQKILELQPGKSGYVTFSTKSETFGIQLVEMSDHLGTKTIMAVGQPLGRRLQPYKKLLWLFGVMIFVSALISSWVIYQLTGRIVSPLDEIAFKDALTSLANRRMFDKHFSLLAQDFRAFGTGYALMILDLNKFKYVNDTYGHAAGDQVLKEVAQRVRAILRSGDTVARLGGDEFAVLLVTDDRSKVAQIAGTIVEKIREPMFFESHELEVGASIGIAMAPYSAKEAEEIFRLADAAMYVAKKSTVGFQFSKES